MGARNESLNTGFNLRPYTKVMGIGLTTGPFTTFRMANFILF